MDKSWRPFSRADSGDLSSDLGDLFVELGKVARGYETGAFLFFDEVQYLEPKEFSVLIMALHFTAPHFAEYVRRKYPGFEPASRPMDGGQVASQCSAGARPNQRRGPGYAVARSLHARPLTSGRRAARRLA